MQVGFVGCGRRGRHHMSVFSQIGGVTIAGVADPVLAARTSAADEFGSRPFESVSDLVQRAEPDGLVVSAPAHLNAAAADPALRFGIPTIVEKPPGLSSEETRHLRDIAKESSTEVMVGFDRRFNPLVTAGIAQLGGSQSLVQLVGEFHKDITEFTGDSRISPEMYDLTMLESPIHTIDLLRFIADSDVSTVRGIAKRVNSRYRDVHAALIEFKNGVVAQFSANYTTGGRLERYEIHGDEVSCYLEGIRSGVAYVKGEKTVLEADPTVGAVNQMRYFLDCVKEDRPIEQPAANLDTAIDTMEVALKILNSVRN